MTFELLEGDATTELAERIVSGAGLSRRIAGENSRDLTDLTQDLIKCIADVIREDTWIARRWHPEAK